MPLDVARLRDSELASNETPEACWGAVLLWCASWHQVPAASMPDDDKWIAKQAGYAQRGKIDKAWADVRAGALRGWVKCDDGRLYHPVVAEKAREAWQAKLEQRWRTECGRIKKHNDRHAGANVPKPSFEEWLALGCPVGQPLFVPMDTPPPSVGQGGETHSKRQGEGQGQGQGDFYSDPNGSGAAAAPPPVDKSTEDKRAAWRDCGRWMVASGMAEVTAREVMGKVLKDFPAAAIDAFTAAAKQPVTPDPKSYLIATAQRLAGERRDPVTVPSDDADRTKAELERRDAEWRAAQAAAGGGKVPAAVLEAKARIRVLASPQPAAEGADA